MIRVFEGFDASCPSSRRLPVKLLRLYQRETVEPELERQLVMTLQSGRSFDIQAVLATCPFCNIHLGAQDHYIGDYIWRDGTEHYVTAHRLVPPSLLKLLEFVSPSTT